MGGWAAQGDKSGEKGEKREREKVQWNQDLFGSTRRVALTEREKTIKLGSYHVQEKKKVGSAERRKINR